MAVTELRRVRGRDLQPRMPGSGAVPRTDQELPFHHPDRMRRDVRQVVGQEWEHWWGRTQYTCALHVEYLLQLLDRHGLMHVLLADVESREPVEGRLAA